MNCPLTAGFELLLQVADGLGLPVGDVTAHAREHRAVERFDLARFGADARVLDGAAREATALAEAARRGGADLCRAWSGGGGARAAEAVDGVVAGLVRDSERLATAGEALVAAHTGLTEVLASYREAMAPVVEPRLAGIAFAALPGAVLTGQVRLDEVAGEAAARLTLADRAARSVHTALAGVLGALAADWESIAAASRSPEPPRRGAPGPGPAGSRRAPGAAPPPLDGPATAVTPVVLAPEYATVADATRSGVTVADTAAGAETGTETRVEAETGTGAGAGTEAGAATRREPVAEPETAETGGAGSGGELALADE